MIALPPAVAAQECIQAASTTMAQVQMIVELHGDAADISSVMATSASPPWTVTTDATDHGQRHVVLLIGQAATYKQIGSFIYTAQAKKLAVSTRTNPPICGTDNN